MPGTPHERMVLLLKAHPKLIELLFKLASPASEASPEAPSFVVPGINDSTVRGSSPEEYHPDLLFADGDDGYAIVTEVQQSRNEAAKW